MNTDRGKIIQFSQLLNSSQARKPWTDLRSSAQICANLRLNVFLRPLANAVQRFFQVFKRIGNAEAQVAFSILAKRRAGETCDTGLLKQRVGQTLRSPACLLDIWKRVKGAMRQLATEAFDLVEARDEDVAPPVKLPAHSSDGALAAAQSFHTSDLGEAD